MIYCFVNTSTEIKPEAPFSFCTTCFTPPSPLSERDTLSKEKIRYRCTRGSCEQTHANASGLSGHVKRVHLEARQVFFVPERRLPEDVQIPVWPLDSSPSACDAHLHHPWTGDRRQRRIPGPPRQAQARTPVLHNQEQPQDACQEKARRYHAVSNCTGGLETSPFGKFKCRGGSSCRCTGTGTHLKVLLPSHSIQDYCETQGGSGPWDSLPPSE
jgi:hypothetical protein